MNIVIGKWCRKMTKANENKINRRDYRSYGNMSQSGDLTEEEYDYTCSIIIKWRQMQKGNYNRDAAVRL